MTISRTICLGFLALIAIGTLLLTLPIASTQDWSWNQLLVAVFTSTSSVCVTGHAVVDTGTYFTTFGHVVIIGLVQVGGLGYMTVTTLLLLLLGRKFGLRDKVALQQALDRSGIQGATQVLRSIIATTLIFEITGIFLLLWVFYPRYGLDRGLWLAVFHSISAFNNAGFSLFVNNLIDYQGSLLLNLVITGLIIFGGIGFEVILELYLLVRDRLQRRAEPTALSLNFKVAVSTTVLLLVLGTVAFLFTENNNPATLEPMDWSTKILAAWFQSVTARTAGFNTIDVGKMTTAGLFITILLMFIGGSPGGTAGGIKTTTLRVLTSSTKAILRGKEEVTLYDRQVPLTLILKAVGVAVGSVTAVIIITVMISLFDPELPFVQILFDTVSSFGTVGLSSGLTLDPNLSPYSKLALSAMMYIGRVGVLLLMSAIVGDPKPSFVRCPEENLLVG
ncbi:ATPase [Leptolyngbya sp. FACHB-36]|uniref:TrkH family potassium uptake protein n=1 Tax=Leptolyngbya sp. FACHB-36 TaxID=2692808 RepID=UPI00168169D1|nr:TrkH family potassium uptake protein [Leptolyngbya sp. FACHB-36]MBD2022318.1 ATPase [Leptolyngbya sp. FACHB-36]